MADIREEKFILRLAELLRAEGLDAEGESEQTGGKRIDVLVRIGQRRIAVEAKKGTLAANRNEALAAAAGRIADDLADGAVAVCYPENQAIGDLNLDTRLWATPVGGDWTETDVASVAAATRRTSDDLADIDAAAARFKENLKIAAGLLSKRQVEDIASSVHIPLGAGQPALRAALLVASACLFHTRLDGAPLRKPMTDVRTGSAYTGDWPFAPLADCLSDTDPIGKLTGAWEIILAVDYKPVFETALTVISAPRAQNPRLTGFVQRCGYAALAAARALGGGQLDLLGRVFHFILDEARHTGAFYTSTAGAALLAGLAIREEDVDQDLTYSVVDPACGTGTLLAAAAARLRDLSGQHGPLGGRELIENTLHGYDIDIAATHMAAVTLGLMAPDVAFRKMNIHRFRLGMVDDPLSNGKVTRAGSLELMREDGLVAVAGWPQAARSGQVDTGENGVLQAIPRRLVIMNPPFSRDSLRHKQLGKQAANQVKQREQELFADKPVYKSHSGGMFLILSERLCAEEDGSVALVYPTAACGAPSAVGVWKYLLERFHLETVVTSHDPGRIAFSENTNINESLFVLRRRNGDNRDQPTRFVNLARNPATASEAELLARTIVRNEQSSRLSRTVVEWPRDRLLADDWTPVRFFSAYLMETAYSWFGNGDLELVPLSKVAEVGPGGQRTQDAYFRGQVADETGRQGLWYNNQTDPAPNGSPPKKTLRTKPDCFLHRKANDKRRLKDLADKYWKQRGRLLLPIRLRTSVLILSATVTDEPVLGSAWIPAKPHNERTGWEEAMVMYLNSTVGILATLYRANPKILDYPNMPLERMRNIPAPLLDDKQVISLANHFRRFADRPLLRLRDQANDTVRASLDEVVCLTMGWDQEEVRRARRTLSEEPYITGRPAGEPDSHQGRPGKGRESRSRAHPALFQDQ